MGVLENLTFSVTELLALLGVGQALLILVHVIFRMTSIRAAGPYLAYFLVLSFAFAIQLLFRIEPLYFQMTYAAWFLWSLSTPLSVLLILTILRDGKPLQSWRYLVLTIQPIAAVVAMWMVRDAAACDVGVMCQNAFDFYIASGVVAQCLAFGFLAKLDLSLKEFRTQDNYNERYWIIVCFIVTNLALIGVALWYLNKSLPLSDLSIARVILGLVMIYMMSTLMFRIYPGVLELREEDPKKRPYNVTDEDVALKNKITDLMTLDKLYQEPSFSRSDLARELEVSEATISTVINRLFDKNFSSFVNEYRVLEAQDLLKTSKYSVSDVASMAGFNSLASFNRVFKDISGVTPTQYRKKKSA